MDAPLARTGWRIRTTLLHRSDVGQWDARVTAGQLAGLGEGADAAARLEARREYLAGSAQNRELERALRERPEAFGVVGRVVLGADEVRWVPDGARSSGTLDLLAPECVDGYQRIALITRLAAELPPEHLDLAVLDVRVVTGAARDLARAEHDRAHLYDNPAQPQDLLVREPVMRRLVEEFDRDRRYFGFRRGERRGPHRDGYYVCQATTALALFAPGSRPDLAHRTLGDAGRQEIWRDPAGPDFRALFDERTRATGIHIAVTFHRAIVDVLAELLRESPAHHRHLLEDAPDLLVWAVARQLPVDRLHCGQWDPAAPQWDRILDEVPVLTRRTAERFVRAYEELRPHGVHRKAEVRELAYWHRLIERAGLDG